MVRASKKAPRRLKKPVKTGMVFVFGIVFALGALFFLAPNANYSAGFETLEEVVADANSKEELAPPENFKDHRRPSWKTYYTKNQPGFFSQKLNNVLALLGLKKRPYWSPSYFKNLLEKRIEEREKLGLSSKYEYVNRIVPTENSRLIVWGDLTGAYHSMVRGLQKLAKLNIIDNDLQLKNKDDYIILMGDAAARSPFIMELLTLIMKLEERNPNRVIYITGNNERRGAWYTYGLREALTYRAAEQTSQDKPLYKTVEQYFETLPLAVYASIPPHTSKDFVRFSHFARKTPSKESYRNFVELLDDSYFSEELQHPKKEGQNLVVKLDEKQNIPDVDVVNVKAIIKSYRKTREYQKNDGLRFLVPDEGATAWSILSSPTVFVQKVLNFYDDAFVIIKCGLNIEDWTITLYTRDIREKNDFTKKEYNFLSGKSLNKDLTREDGTQRLKKNNRRIRR